MWLTWSPWRIPSRSRRAARRVPARRRPCVECLEVRALPSTAILLRDINPLPAGAGPEALVNVNGTLFFSAADDERGRELWKSDGTTAGTVPVKDIVPGPGSSAPQQLTNVGGTLFFLATEPGRGYELWTSDGTAAGTALVNDINPGGAGSGYPGKPSLLNLGGTLFFIATDGATGFELWKSDGTAAGTVLVKDINPGPGGSLDAFATGSLTNAGGTLFFAAFAPGSGIELWKSDGTTAGTALVKDINPGFSDAYPASPTNLNGTLFFTADDDASGRELWRSDGTAAGTQLVKDIRSGFLGSFPAWLAGLGRTLYFAADDGSGGIELWRSDGTAGGTALVKDLVAGSGGSAPAGLVNVGGRLFFAADGGATGSELWTSDGSAAGTALVKDINSGPAQSFIAFPTNLGGLLFFRAADGTSGDELWQSDGTAAGTVLVQDLRPGAQGSVPSLLTDVGGKLYFRAEDGAVGAELWKLNREPTAAITGPATGAVVAPGAPVTFSGTFADADASDTHTAVWTLTSDALPGPVTVPGTVVQAGGTVSATFAFTAPGVYRVALTVTDSDGASATATTVGGVEATFAVREVVVPAGFVTGGGWFNSPAGAYLAGPGLTGKAHFNLEARHPSGSAVPVGETELRFRAAGLSFLSTGYDALAVGGATARYGGTGTMNGAGGYRFLIVALDGRAPGGGGQDRIRVRIWNAATGAVVYDTQPGAPDDAAPTTATRGNIKFHRARDGDGDARDAVFALTGKKEKRPR